MSPERWRKIEELYHAAVALDAGARTAFLDNACGPDRELREEVESLLGLETRAAEFLESRAQNATDAGPLPAKIGSYQVSSRLGAGGMGEVYRGHDSKLGRDVALKTLPRAFASHPERLARFRREARLLAALNHPNIAAIYGLEESDAATCLVLELVEGETLSGPLPVEQALEYARQVAEALEAAHAQAIVHRDLKPANVKVTPQGRIKVLDFGLAKALSAHEDSADVSQEAPTTLETAAGHIAGTPAYMSPEQARGAAVDQRADIWAFGCLLYELLSGKRAFGRETVVETLAAVLEREPDWSALPARTPGRIRKLLRACLVKDADRRVPDIKSVREEIVRYQRRFSRRMAALLTTVSAAALIVSAAIYFHAPARQIARSEWVQLTNFPDSVSQPALSGDGRMLAFIRGPETFVAPGEIYVKRLPDGEPVQLTDDNRRKMSPVFSPGDATLAYTLWTGVEGWDTWVTPLAPGQARPWLTNASGLTWLNQQRLLFSALENDIHMGIVTADKNRAGARTLYMPAGSRGMAHRTYPSPDGKWALVVEMDRGNWIPCRLVSIDGNSAGRQVGPADAACTFAGWSPDGKWMYLSSSAGGGYHIWRQLFPDGRPEQLTSGPTEEEGIAVAPDGRSLITSVGLRQSIVYIHSPAGDRALSREGYSFDPKFTPDGKKLCYRILKGVMPQGDASDLRIVDLDSGRDESLLPGFGVFGQIGSAYDISSDGRQVVAAVRDREGKVRLWIGDINGQSPPRQIPNVEGDFPHFGAGDVFFRHIDGPSAASIYRVRQDGSQLQLITGKVVAPRSVSPDGRWLIARLEEEPTPVQTAIPLHGGTPVRIYAGEAWYWDWSADQKLLYLSVPESAMTMFAGRTYVVPLSGDNPLPPVREGGFQSSGELAKLPGVRIIDAFDVAPGPSLDVYAFSRPSAQRNLYRIPLP